MNLGKKVGVAALTLGVAGGIFIVHAQSNIGARLDEFRGVAVYDNGPAIATSHGRHYAKDGYYYGQKWQCVEFVKRFFHQAHQHRMPDVWGHAKDFFDDAVPHGQLNKGRGLLQFRNGGDIAPTVGDLIVFTNGSYGHVAIVSAVTSNRVEVIQQNILGRPRNLFSYSTNASRHEVGSSWRPAGWLRVPPKS